jgi:hypothetical protein
MVAEFITAQSIAHIAERWSGGALNGGCRSLFEPALKILLPLLG